MAANWRSYGSDIANTRYSPLNQIDAGNFSKLQLAWIFNTAIYGRRRRRIGIDAAGDRWSVLFHGRGPADVVALDAATGEVLWTHREDEGKRGEVAPRRLSGRGLAYWAAPTMMLVMSLSEQVRLGIHALQ